MFTGSIREYETKNHIFVRRYQYVCDYCGQKYECNSDNHNRHVKNERKLSFCSSSCSYKSPKRTPIRGGRKYNGYGYVLIVVPFDCPNARKAIGNHYIILEHRKVMQDHLGRPLLKTETVHHKNGIKDDNRIENLELRSGSHGQGATAYTEDVNRLLSENAMLKSKLDHITIGNSKGVSEE